MLSIHFYAVFCYVKRHFAECRKDGIILKKAIVIGLILLFVMLLFVILLNVIMLSVILLSVILLSVI